MKNLFFSIVLVALFSCNNDEITTLSNNTNPIEGTWSLVSVSGGFAPTLNLDPSWITYHFGQNLTVIDANPSTTLQSTGLEAGSYAYSFNENITTCGIPNYYKLSISNFINEVCIKIEGNEMTIDTNSGADGLLYKFIRTNFYNGEECIGLVHTMVDTTTVPENGTTNQPISIAIDFTVNNGCGNFGYIAETNSGNTKTLKVFARYIGCVCTLALMPIQKTYTFTPTTSGEQIIKIEQPDGSFLTNTITIL